MSIRWEKVAAECGSIGCMHFDGAAFYAYFFVGCHSRIVDCENKIIPLTIDAIPKQSLTIETIKIDATVAATAAAAAAAMGAEQKKICGFNRFFYRCRRWCHRLLRVYGLKFTDKPKCSGKSYLD